MNSIFDYNIAHPQFSVGYIEDSGFVVEIYPEFNKTLKNSKIFHIDVLARIFSQKKSVRHQKGKLDSSRAYSSINPSKTRKGRKKDISKYNLGFLAKYSNHYNDIYSYVSKKDVLKTLKILFGELNSNE